MLEEKRHCNYTCNCNKEEENEEVVLDVVELPEKRIVQEIVKEKK